MQTIEALILSQAASNPSAGTLANLSTLNRSANANQSARTAPSRQGAVDPQVDNANSGTGVFSPANFMSPAVTSRNPNDGNSGNGGGSANNQSNRVAPSAIERMLEMMIAQTLGDQANPGMNTALNTDKATLSPTPGDNEADDFNALLPQLVNLLALQTNTNASSSATPSTSIDQLMAAVQPSQSQGQMSSQQLQSMLEQVNQEYVLAHPNGTGDKSNGMNSDSGSPIFNNIMGMLQTLLTQQSNGVEIPAGQLQSMISTLAALGAQNPSSPTSAAIQTMLPQLMAMANAHATQSAGAAAKQAPTTFASLRGAVDSSGKGYGSTGENSGANYTLKPDANGFATILDGSSTPDVAGGFGISAKLAPKDGDGQGEAIQSGAFSWNNGNDAIRLTADGSAEVTANGGRSWNQLPTSGVSTYTPGGSGPSLMYNPATKTVNFQATGSNSQSVNATMQAGSGGVSFTDIQGTNGISASGQLASALSTPVAGATS